MDLFELAAKISLDSSDFDKGIADAESSGKGLGSSLEGVFSKLQTAAKAFISGAVIKKGIDLVRQLASETAEMGDRIDKQSQVLGMSRRAYQEWDYILGQNGISIDNMATAMKTLNSAILSAADGSEEYNGALVRLGLNFVDLQDMNPEEQFEAVVRAFQQMPEGAEKSALAVKLFGRQGMQLLPLLNSESASIDELRARAEELGIIMSDDAINASVEYGDALDTLQRTFNAVKYSLGAKLLPVFTNVITKLTNYAGKLVNAFNENGFKGVWDTLRGDVENLKYSDSPFLAGLGTALGFVMDAAQGVYNLITDFPGTIQSMKESDSPLLKGLAFVLEGIQTVWNGILSLIKDFPGTIKSMQESDSPLLNALALVLNGIKSTWDLIVDLINDFPGTLESMRTSDNFALTVLYELLCDIESVFNAIIKLINGDWQGAVIELKKSNGEIASSLGVLLETFDQGRYRIQGFIDDTREALGMSGAGGKLYKTYADKMAQSFRNITNEEELEAWIDEFTQGLKDAEFDAASILTIVERIRSHGYKTNADKSGVGTEIGQLAGVNNPYGNETLIDFWRQQAEWTAVGNTVSQSERAHDFLENVKRQLSLAENVAEESRIPMILSPEADEEKLEAERQEIQRILDEHPVLLDIVPRTTFEAPTYMFGTPSGHNAKGMWDVPYDDYLTTLHRDEMVLSASRARDYREGKSDGGVNLASVISELKESIRSAMENVTVRSYLNGRDITAEVNRETIKQLKARRFAT